MGVVEGVLKSIWKKKGFKLGSWRTRYINGKVILSRYGTDMLRFNPKTKRAELSTGFESSSDKKGITIVLRALGVPGSKIKRIKATRGFSF